MNAVVSFIVQLPVQFNKCLPRSCPEVEAGLRAVTSSPRDAGGEADAQTAHCTDFSRPQLLVLKCAHRVFTQPRISIETRQCSCSRVRHLMSAMMEY